MPWLCDKVTSTVYECVLHACPHPRTISAYASRCCTYGPGAVCVCVCDDQTTVHPCSAYGTYSHRPAVSLTVQQRGEAGLFINTFLLCS